MTLPPSNRFLKVYIPDGIAKCSYACEGDNKSCSSFHPSSVRVRMDPFTEVTWVITNDGNITRMQLYATLQIPPEELEKAKKVLASTYSIAGLAQSATAVGYIQFFWTESPIRLRTTLYAIFIVSNELLKFMTTLFVTSVSVNIALVCVCLSCFGFFAHVVVGLWYDLRFRREIWLYLEESSKDEDLSKPK
uniref:Putative nitrite transporter At1g68570 n=1 Tax=Lygus hesperus TaxID=30085 RepID=A0A0A9ZGV0_LYGHE